MEVHNLFRTFAPYNNDPKDMNANSYAAKVGDSFMTALSEVESEEGTLSFVRSQTTKEQ